MGSGRDDLIWAVGVAAEAFLAGTAWRAASRVREHRPVAAVVTYGLGADLAMRFLQAAFLEGAPRPFTGAARLAYHGEVALFFGWPCALALLAAHVFRPGRPGSVFAGWAPSWVPVGVWFGLVPGHILTFPLGGKRTAKLFFWVEIAALAWAAVSVIRSWRTRWGRQHAATLFLLGTELVIVLLGPFITSIYQDWNLAKLLYTTSFLTLGGWYLRRAARHLPSTP